jgi:DNA-binding transcriptional MocR family regulator
MKRRTDKRGRSKGSLGSFVAVERYIMQTIAWRSLTPNARASYLEVYYGYDGVNNGRILLSSQMLADRLNRNKSTAARALKELEQYGFIECQSKGGFNCKLPHASEWRVTALKCDVTNASPSKRFMHWKPQDSKRSGTGELSGGIGTTDKPKATQNSPSQWHMHNREGSFEGVGGGTGATPLYSNQTAVATHTALNAQPACNLQVVAGIASPHMANKLEENTYP